MQPSGLQLRPLSVEADSGPEGPFGGPFDPAAVKVSMNVRLDAAFVPRAHEGGARVSYCHVVVLDSFCTEDQRATLLGALSGPDAVQGAPHGAPPSHKWERRTADGAGLPPTWGVRPSVMAQLERAAELAGDVDVGGIGRAMRQLQGRLCALYPDYDIFHMPSEAMQLGMRVATATESSQGVTDPNALDRQQSSQLGSDQPCSSAASKGSRGWAEGTTDADQQLSKRSRCRQQDGHLYQAAAVVAAQGSCSSPTATRVLACTPQPAAAAGVDCGLYVANAAVQGDQFQWHIDADPSDLFPGPWVDAWGLYFNGEPGRPLLVTMLLYLDKEWPRHFDAETLFLDSGTDTGILVRPKAYRAVLMDQDCLHRLSVPSVSAARPRYSLVWKLVFIRKRGLGVGGALEPCIARAEWGPPADFGTAARVAALKRALEKQEHRP